jgi:hypothetical protein
MCAHEMFRVTRKYDVSSGYYCWLCVEESLTINVDSFNVDVDLLNVY